MTKMWILALAVALPLSAADAQIGAPIGGAPAGAASGGGANASGNTDPSATGSTTSSSAAKDDPARPSGASQGTVGASGLGWAAPSSQSGSTAGPTASRSGMSVTTTGF
jgi:hypothetical protein